MAFKYFILLTSLICFAHSLRFNLIKDEPEVIQQKYGFCPRTFRNQQTCEILCNSDMDCPGIQKCCLTDCGGQACAKPSDGTVPIVSKPNSVQALPQINQNRCPIVLNLSNKTNKNCLFDGCFSDANCFNGQICCDVQGCKKKACIALNQVVENKPVPQVGSAKINKQDNYDDYANNDYYDYNNQQYYNVYYGYDYNPRGGNKRTKQNYGANFNGPVANTHEQVLPYQRNPFFKINKKEFVNHNLPKYNIHPMSMRIKKSNINYAY